MCSRAGKIIPSDNSACPWYDKCGLTLDKGCSTCPTDLPYKNDGCTCRIDPSTYAKDSYGRGAGVPMGCGSEQYDAGLCYPYCNNGYNGIGPVCWELCPKTFPASEGALCCFTDSSCNKKAVQMAQAVIAAVIAAVEAGVDPSQILAAVKAALEAVLGFVLPSCKDFPLTDPSSDEQRASLEPLSGDDKMVPFVSVTGTPKISVV